MPDLKDSLTGASFSGAVKVRELGPQGMITLRGDLSSQKLRRAVKSATGVEAPSALKISGAGKKSGSQVAWMSPDELLVLTSHASAEDMAEKLAAGLSGQHALVANVSDSRVMLELSGPGFRDVMAKGSPVDFSPGAFALGDFRRSRLGQVAAAFWVAGPSSARLVCFRSVGGYVFRWLCAASAKGSLPGYYSR